MTTEATWRQQQRRPHRRAKGFGGDGTRVFVKTMKVSLTVMSAERGAAMAVTTWTSAVTAEHYSSVMRTLGSNARCLTSPWGKGSGAGSSSLSTSETRRDFMPAPTYWLCSCGARALCVHALSAKASTPQLNAQRIRLGSLPFCSLSAWLFFFSFCYVHQHALNIFK